MSTNVRTFSFAVGATTRGTFIVSSWASPYFCFECTTEDEAVEKAQRALGFYLNSKSTGENTFVPVSEPTLSPVRRIKTEHAEVSAGEFHAA